MDAATAPTAPFDNGPFADAPARDPRFDNSPPLAERIGLEFAEDLERDGLTARIAELIQSADKAPETIDDEATAGKVGDFIIMARDVEKRVDDAREKHNRPLIEARTALKARADNIMAPLLRAGGTLRERLNDWTRRESARVEAERREAERVAEAARKAAEEEAARNRPAATDDEKGERDAFGLAPIPAPVIQPARIAEPVARGDYGSRVGARTVWRHERQVPIAKLPKAILENEQVVAAVDKVIAAMVRGGTREIKGVRIFETKEASVR